MVDFRFLSRRKVLIKPAYQLRLALNLFAYVIIYSLILGFVIFYPLYQELDAAVGLEEQLRTSSMILYLHKRVWLGFVLVAVLAAVHAVFSSHRVVGPVYRFEKMVGDLIAGDCSVRIKIRKRDEFKEMEALLNRLAESLQVARARDAQFYHDARIKLETIRAMLDAEGADYPSDVKRLAADLIAELNLRDRS